MSLVQSFVQVGKVKDAHGIRGELFIVLFAGEAAWLDELNESHRLRLVRAVHDGAPSNDVRELDLKSARVHKNGLIAKTESIKDRNEAETLKGWILEIPEEFLVSEPGESMYLREVLGFQVSTVAQGSVGPIVGFSSNTVQDLLVVRTASGDFEIPFVEAFVQNIDHAQKTMLLDLPYGLLGEELDVGETPDDQDTERDE